MVVCAPGAKAPEDWRTPRRFANNDATPELRQVLDCGSPLPLWDDSRPFVVGVNSYG